MESTFIPTAAFRDASRPWQAAAFLLSGADNGLRAGTHGSTLSAMGYPVAVPTATHVVAKQDCPPRGVPR
jgi:hypothetical protein